MFNNDFNKLETYIRQHCEPESELLAELDRQTHLKVLRPRMLSGHVQGRVLAMLSKMIAPQYIFEIGTFTGYSAICLAEGLKSEGRLITCDPNDELASFTQSFINRAPDAGKIDYRIADARALIKEFDLMFDLVFIDGDKRQYPEYYEMIVPYVRQGGYIIADNVLWNEKVVDASANDDEYTHGVLTYNKMVTKDPGVENVVFPFRDGLMVARKK
ncbi:MAG TPA: O-methyltransferase [Salinivirga sp.]|uniref:O-methyltransferase n=1 Tax=Salinivirga sp. TaxID=1970192 RepID=UPI002B46D194|nr:O-methyltransferase [Salinivirga sp.]HKK60461.1 O-methyltransferase [Salinivirga sp.]